MGRVSVLPPWTDSWSLVCLCLCLSPLLRAGWLARRQHVDHSNSSFPSRATVLATPPADPPARPTTRCLFSSEPRRHEAERRTRTPEFHVPAQETQTERRKVYLVEHVPCLSLSSFGLYAQPRPLFHPYRAHPMNMLAHRASTQSLHKDSQQPGLLADALKNAWTTRTHLHRNWPLTASIPPHPLNPSRPHPAPHADTCRSHSRPPRHCSCCVWQCC